MFGIGSNELILILAALLILIYSILAILIPVFVYQIKVNTRETRRLMEKLLERIPKDPARHYRIDP